MSLATRVDPEKQFEQDIPEEMWEDVMLMMTEAAHCDKAHENVTILERDWYDAINVQVSGIIKINDEEYSFQLASGNRNGTELLDWNGNRTFVPHVPTRYALQPKRQLVLDAIEKENGPFLVVKWDAMLKNHRKIAEIPDKYTYDKRFQPGTLIERHYQAEAAKHHFEIVTEETAAETRKKLLAATKKTSNEDNH